MECLLETKAVEFIQGLHQTPVVDYEEGTFHCPTSRGCSIFPSMRVTPSNV